uniref:Methyltransferase/helicase n=1 Tax=Grapevine leafroll-associated virus 4 TaxID=70177 RepID=A0A344EAN9_9CLOS|nr:methyltransferase/helicase [Grapevine leafroll-associated virus 4]
MPRPSSSSDDPPLAAPSHSSFPNPTAAHQVWIPKTTYKNNTSVISGSTAHRTRKTEQERAQGPQSKFSNLTAKGKAALKGKGKQATDQPRKPSNKELATVYRSCGRVLSYNSKIPASAPRSNSVSSASSSPKSYISSSCSYHSSISSGPSFSLPKQYTSVADVKEAIKYNSPSPPTSPKQPVRDVPTQKPQFGTVSLPETHKVQASRGSNPPSSGTKSKVETTVYKPDGSSSSKALSQNAPKAGISAAQHSGALPDREQPRRVNNWGNIRRKPDSEFPQKPEINFQALKSVGDVRKLQIFPSELTLRSQERLCNVLDTINHSANDVAKSYVISRIQGDSLKAMHHLFLITNSGRVHFFNPLGYYVGQVVVNEPTWFYGRIAGSAKNMYLSLGNSKTSKCFLKSRFPTLAEFLANDWAKGKSSLRHVSVFDPVKNRNWRGDRGFCWLPLYLNSELPLTQYPTGGLVRLFTLYDKFGPVPIVKSGKYYHYDVKGKKHIKFPNVWVGAQNQDVTEDITTWEDCNSDPLLRTAVDSVLKRTVLKETSNFQTNIDNLFDKALTHTLSSTRNEKLTISQHLTAEEFELLKGYFGLPYLGNGNAPRNPHSLLNAMREVFNKLYAKAFRGVSVSDIGGNLSTAVFSDCSNTHICMPILDAKDAARQTRSAIALFNSLDSKIEGKFLLAKRLQTLNNISFCHDAVPKCAVKSTAIVMVDVYDMHLKLLIKAMEKKGALIARCCFMFPPELLNTDGIVVHPETSVVVTRSGQTVSYNIANTADSYTHNLDNVMSFLKTSSLRSDTGFLYSVELVNQNGPYMDFQIALSRGTSTKPGLRSFQAWLKNKSEVIVQKLLDDGSVSNLKLIVDRDFVRRVLSYSANVCNTLDDRTYEYVLSNIRSQTTMMIVGSKIVHNKVDISNDVIVELPGTFLKEAVKRRRRAVEQAKKSNPGFFRKLLANIFSFPRRLISFIVSAIRRLLPSKIRKTFDQLLDDPGLISDCADVIVTETSNDVSDVVLKNEILEDVLNAVKDLTLLSAPEPEPEIVEEPEGEENSEEIEVSNSRKQKRGKSTDAHIRREGLKGGANGSWYDFILPKKASAKTGSSILADLWRLVRKLDLAFRNSRIMGLVMKLLKLILKVLKVVLGMLVADPQRFYPNKQEKFSPLQSVARSVKSILGSFLEALVSFIDNSILGKVLGVIGEAKECLVDNINDFSTNITNRTIDGLKTRIACGFKTIGLKPPKGWLKDSSVATLVLEKVMSELKRAPLFPLAASVLITLVASKRIREKVLGFTNKVVCFIESIKIKRPIFLCSIILGAILKNLSRFAFTLAPFEDCKEMCVGMLFSNVVHSAYNSYQQPNMSNRLELLTNFLMLQSNMDILTSVITFERRMDEGTVTKDVTNVEPKLSTLELNSDIEEVINNFRTSVDSMRAGKRSPITPSMEVGETSEKKPVKTSSDTKSETKGTKVRVEKAKGKEIREPAAQEEKKFPKVKGKGVQITEVEDVGTSKTGDTKLKEKEPLDENVRFPKPTTINLERVRESVFSEEESNAAVDKSTNVAVPEASNELQLKETEEESRQFLDEIIEQFNRGLMDNELDDKDDSTTVLAGVKNESSDQEDSESSSDISVEDVVVLDTASDSSEEPLHETVGELPHLNCSCGLNIDVKPFTVPGPLPLLKGDKLNGREAWFYSRKGDGYSYVGGSHVSRGWLNILNRYISNTGLNPNLFDHCLIQKYECGAGIPYHKDNEPVYPKNNPILTIHVSGEGMFSIRCNNGSGEVLLKPPSWFLMPFGFQITHQHSVTCATVRVSMTFRSTEVITNLDGVNRSLQLAVRGGGSNSQNHSSTEDKPKGNASTDVSLRPQTTLLKTVKSGNGENSLLDVCAKNTGVKITSVSDLLDKESYKGMKHYVSISGNVGAVIEAFLYNLHELHKEISVISKALEQPEILVGKRREVYSSCIPDLDRLKVCKQPETLLSSAVNSLYGSIEQKKIIFSTDKSLETEDEVLYLTPANISFALKRCIGMFQMMSKLTLVDIERAIVGCKFINAVPGAGKTHEIKLLMKSHAQNKFTKGLMIVLTSSRNAAESLNTYWEDELNDKRVLVMTVDSFVFSGGKFSSREVESVLLDECYMSHAGLCILISAITNPSSLSFYGDRRQVPFVNRNPIFRDTMGMLNIKGGDYSEKLLTYRCPADICYWMSTIDFLKPGARLYSGKVTTVKDKRPLKSVKVTPFSPNQLDFMKSVDRVMTFTQMEKTDLISKFQIAGFGNKEEAINLIGTVAESQGETYARVALVRTKAADDPVFGSFPHRLVALTRHTVSLQFVCLPNKMSKGIGSDCKMIEKLEASVAKTFVVQHHV